ncbi:hypothetical protein, partial [Streptomyces acidiscabies]|uniref:hypothetical protein n=1 Tax=Streptomyces acidiscabies TaxID=42234 RepID=UPI000AF29FA3
MIDLLHAALAAAGYDATPEELADILWLAAHPRTPVRRAGDEGVRFWFDAATVGHTGKKPKEKTYFAYGGDWGDFPNDGA